MSLNPIVPRLRAVKHNAISASKVQISVPAGDVLLVSDVVADQLIAAAGEFQSVDEDREDEPQVEQATASPGEKRTTRKRAAKPKS